MKCVYVGKNAPGSSMYLVGQQIVDNAGGVLCTTVDEHMSAGAYVLCTIPEDLPKLEKARRFTGMGKIVTLLAGNWEEYDAWTASAILGYAVDHVFVVHSQHSFDQVRGAARDFLSPAKYRSLMTNLKLVLYGVGLEFSPQKRDPMKWVVPYNRVNQTQKNLNLHTEITQAFLVHNRGAVNTLFIMLPRDNKDMDLSAYAVVTQPSTREEYLQLIADRGAFLCTSNFESFGIYYLELLCSGAVGVFMDKPWVHRLLPGYPLIASSKTEALVMMQGVTTDYDHWYDVLVRTWIPLIRQTYVLKNFATQIMNL